MQPIPTLQQIASNMGNDFKNKFNLSTEYLKRVLNAITAVVSAQVHLIYMYLRDVQDNVFPDTATTEANGGTLERQGLIYLNRGLFPASIGVFLVSVDAKAGSVLRANLTFKSNEGSRNPGQVYVLDTEYTCTGTDDVIEVRSIGSGSAYNLNVADNLTITEPVIGVDKTVVVTSVEEQPRAEETIENYREAILRAIQLEPQGGSRADYRQWSTDAQGVRLVYPYVVDVTSGIVSVYVEAVLSDSDDGKGTPTTAILDDVEEVLNYDPDITKPIYERGRKPAQCFLEIEPISLIPVDVKITGLNDDSTSVRNAIENSVVDMLYKIRPFISGADLRRNKNDILYYGKMQSVVTESLINGNFFNELELKVDGNEIVSYEFDLGNIPFLNSITFV